MSSALYTVVYNKAGARATFERCDESVSRPFNKRSVESRTIDPAALCAESLKKKVDRLLSKRRKRDGSS